MTQLDLFATERPPAPPRPPCEACGELPGGVGGTNLCMTGYLLRNHVLSAMRSLVKIDAGESIVNRRGKELKPDERANLRKHILRQLREARTCATQHGIDVDALSLDGAA